MRKILKKIIILFFYSALLGINLIYCYGINGEVRFKSHYPKEYNITINNINKNDVDKIEVFTPWGYFRDNDRVEIDGRLFNYNNNYDNGIDGKEYEGVKCKIIDTINKEDIKQVKNGIEFVLSPQNSGNLKIYLKNGKEIFSDEIESELMFSYIRGGSNDEKDMKEIKKFEKKTVYFMGEFEKNNSNNPWIEIKITKIKANNNLIIIITIVVLTCAAIELYIIKNGKSKKNNNKHNNY